MLRAAITLSFVMMVTVGGARAGELETGGQVDVEEGESPAFATVDSTPSQTATAKGKTKASRVAAKKARRGGRKPRLVGAVVPEEKLRAEPAPRPSGDLHLANLATHEEAKVNIYNADGSYDVESLKTLNHLLRCKRTETEKEIDPRLFVVLSHVHDRYPGKAIELVSGFRNQRRTTSFHYKGSASDIRIAGVSPKELRAFVETLDAGGMGIGLYPVSKFVHVDVRPAPSYRWIDWSPAEPNAPGKQPPRGFKKKRLQS